MELPTTFSLVYRDGDLHPYVQIPVHVFYASIAEERNSYGKRQSYLGFRAVTIHQKLRRLGLWELEKVLRPLVNYSLLSTV
jgi:hypothetical protein